jgi:dienelactone hydrolase
MRNAHFVPVMALGLVAIGTLAADDKTEEFASRLRELNAQVIASEPPWGALAQMLAKDARTRIQAANRRESAAWHLLRSKQDWERYRDERVGKLRDSIGKLPAPGTELKTIETKRFESDGFIIQNLVMETRPGLFMAANVYSPAKPGSAMPGVVICHSHHNSKTQSELQDMGIGWAKQGCVVVIPDLLGHGERRQHPFSDESKYPGPFRVGRQDYYFRYNLGVQLQLVGESLIGWFAWDLMRCVEFLLSQKGVDPGKIAMLGSVAGGGDPVAVTAALDPRIKVAAVFNFGGPQPESTYPLPADSEDKFNYAGGGSWESTRTLRRSAADGFLPWVIVGSIAPRKLLYCHEFSWDRENDPVWKRLQKIYEWYGAPNNLAAATGTGTLTGKNPAGSHCNNIGPVQLASMTPALKKWLGIDAPAAKTSDRRPAADLRCLKPDHDDTPTACFSLLAKIAEAAQQQSQREFGEEVPGKVRLTLRDRWASLLGEIEPRHEPRVVSRKVEEQSGLRIERLILEVESNTWVPMLLLLPLKPAARTPVVIAFAQEGMAEWLMHRSAALSELLRAGVAVCLPDVRGTGETRPGNGRDRNSSATSISSTELMLGRTMMGLRLKDLRSVLAFLRKYEGIDPKRVAVWGDSFAEPNAPVDRIDAPLDAEKPPRLAEPNGMLLAMLLGLFDDNVAVVAGQGGWCCSFVDLLGTPYCHFPHDAVVPAAATCEISRLASLIAPRPLLLAGFVNGQNQRLTKRDVDDRLDLVRRMYDAYPSRLQIDAGPLQPEVVAKWLIKLLKE